MAETNSCPIAWIKEGKNGLFRFQQLADQSKDVVVSEEA